jgi:cytochrome b involved in lipid metabolism
LVDTEGSREGAEMPTLTKLYSMEEAALHNTPDDCWVIVDGKVAPLYCPLISSLL